MPSAPGFVEVTWIDSESEVGWNSAQGVGVPKGFPKSYGFLINETEDFLTLAADIDPENNHFNRFIHIPLLNVRNVRTIKI